MKLCIIVIIVLCFRKTISKQEKVLSFFKEFDKQVGDLCALDDGSGGFLAVWSADDQDGDNYGIFAQFYDSNLEAAQPEFQVNTETSSYQMSPSVKKAKDGSGNFIISYTSRTNIFFQIINKNSEKIGNEVDVTDYTSSSLRTSRIATLDSGFAVTYKYTSYNKIISRLFNYQGDEISETRETVTYPANSLVYNTFRTESLNEGKEYVVVYSSQGIDNDGYGIVGIKYKNENGIPQRVGEHFLINTDENGDQLLPYVAILKDNTFVVVWEGPTGIFGQKFDNSTYSTKIGDQFTVILNSEMSYLEQKRPAVTFVDGDGDARFFVYWQSSNKDYFGRFYNSDGNADGNYFKINELTHSEMSLSNNVKNIGFNKLALMFNDGMELYGKIICQNQCDGSTPNVVYDSESCQCDCVVGYYRNEEYDCVKCPKNSYKDQIGNFGCIQCPLNSESNIIGSTSLNDCQCKPGYYLEGNNCVACKENHYKNEYGNSEALCVACKGNSSTMEDVIAVSTNNCYCNPGFKFNSQTEECTMCSENNRKKGCKIKC